MLLVYLPHRAIVGRVGPLATSDEHFVLRRQHLIEIALHEDNLIVECLRQKPQQERNDLHSFAARVSEPGRVAVLVELLD